MTSSAGSAICAAGSVDVGWLEICSRISTAARPTSAWAPPSVVSAGRAQVGGEDVVEPDDAHVVGDPHPALLAAAA